MIVSKPNPLAPPKSTSTDAIPASGTMMLNGLMSSLSHPYDNAKAESFFKTLKQEEVYLKEYESFADAEANLAAFIEMVYNTKRLHSSLGYLPPAEFEAAYTPLPGS